MKHKYLYQGWAGNTYSHKCNSSSNLEYLYVYDLDPSIKNMIALQSYAVKTENNFGEHRISPASDSWNDDEIQAVAIDLSMQFYQQQFYTITDDSEFDFNTIPRITKEEFYTVVPESDR